MQEKLREEVNQLGGEITWEQITTGLPYLNAVTQEVLRMHSPLENLLREVNNLPNSSCLCLHADLNERP